MERRTFFIAAGSLAAAFALRVAAQATKLPVRVSFVSHSSPNAYGHLLSAFRAELRALGYAEGRDLTLELLWAEDQLDRLPALFAEALASKPTIIVTHGSANVAQALKATRTVPIVFASAGDPLAQGFIASFRRPGGNITGVSFSNDIGPKVFELAKLVMPGLSRIGAIQNPENPASKLESYRLPRIDKALGIQTLLLKVTSREALEPAFMEARDAKMQAIVVGPHAPLTGLHDSLATLQFKYSLPTFHGLREAVSVGGVASYSFPLEENFRRAAVLVDQILKGRNPGDIPVEIPTKYEIAINLKSARILGLKVPEAALLRAHKVIEA